MIDRATRDAYVKRDSDLRAWMSAHKTNSYHPDELPEALKPTLTNEQRADVELFDWINNPPARYFAYMTNSKPEFITNWTGQNLARIIECGAVYRSNIGDRRQNFRCKGTNGVTYSGTAYIDSGDYVRMRAVKGA